MKKTLPLTYLLLIVLCTANLTAQAGGPYVIITSIDLPSPFCPGQDITINFNPQGTFNAGNTFTAQLSNSNGFFSSPTVIGTLQAQVATSMQATIPSNALYGTGYRIRIINNSPLGTGPDNGSNLTINAPVQSSIEITATPLQIAYGTEQTLFVSGVTNNGSSPSYEWFKNGNATGITDANFTTTTSNDGDQWYCVMATNNACYLPSTSRTLVMEVVAANIIENDITICTGESVTLTATELTYPLGIRGPEGNGYGGYIIYDKGLVSDGWRYLQAASNDQSEPSGSEWGCEGTSIAGTDIIEGAGAANTQLILQECAFRPIAASLCDDYGNGTAYDDWYLPSVNELHYMIGARPYISTIPDPDPNMSLSNPDWAYWSSSDAGATNATLVNLWGSDYYHPKSWMYRVRAVRTFNSEVIYSWSNGTSATGITVSPTETTTYTLTVTRNGITSTESVTVTVNDTSITHQYMTLCHGEGITIQGNIITQSGDYTFSNLTNIAGCDSTVMMHLTILPENTFTQTLTICQGESVTVGSNTYTATNTYTDVLTSLVNGCDSTVTTNLTVDICTGINNSQLSGISIYPNPNNGVFTVTNTAANYVLELHNTLGQLILSQQATQPVTTFNLQNQPEGVYLISIYDGDKKVMSKIVKQ